MRFTRKLFCAALMLSGAVLLRAVDTETVLVTYQAKAGSEAQLERTLDQAWQTLRRLDLVLDTPHVLVRGTDSAGKTRLVEIFTWKDSNTPDHTPQQVQALWSQLESLCEPRSGHPGIDIAQVQVVSPAR